VLMRFPLIMLGVPPCWRTYFLLLRQKKVAKEKATPGCAVGYANFPALLETGGGCGTRATPSDSPRPYSAAFSVARRFTRGPKNSRAQAFGEIIECYGAPGKNTKKRPAQTPDAFSGPLKGAEQRRRTGRFRLALSEPQASLASRPGCRVAQGTRAAGTAPGVAFSLATFFWPHKRKYVRQQGGTPSKTTIPSQLNTPNQ
jgi:hypothetical protein